MNILFLAPYPPYPPRGGGQQRIFQFIRLAAQQHKVWLLTFSPHEQASAALDPLRAYCHVITVPTPRHTLPKRFRTLVASALPDMVLRGQSLRFQQALDHMLGHVPFDVVQAESIEMAQYGAPRPNGPLWVYDAFNAEFLIQRRAFATDVRTLRKLPIAAYSFAQWQKLRLYEKQLGRYFGGALAVSAADAAMLRSLAPSLPVTIVPNGVDTSAFSPATATTQSTAPYVLFTGTLDFRPNIDAVTWFSYEVLPLIQAQRPAVRFVVVGRNPSPGVRNLGKLPGVEIVGEVADVRPWFSGAAAYVVPMRIGGGVRLKLLEALSMAQPVIATRMGAEGVEGLHDGVHALFADQPAAYAAHVLRVLNDPTTAQRLGAAGRALVVERYDWQSIVPRMLAQWTAWRGAAAVGMCETHRR